MKRCFLSLEKAVNVDGETVEHLRSLLGRVAELSRQGKRALVVLDLDSTIFDTSYRSAAIFRHWAQNSRHREHYGELCEVISSWQEPYEIYDPVEFIRTHTPSFSQWSVELERELRRYWRARFFQSSWLSYDQPYEGAVGYIQQLRRLGAWVRYLSARSRLSMEQGTYESLKKHGFPLPPSSLREAVILKDSPQRCDIDFKKEALGRLKQGFHEVFFIENEPSIVVMCGLSHPDIKNYHYDSVHSGMTPAEGCGSCVLKHWWGCS